MNAHISAFAISSLTDRELLDRLPGLVRKERQASAEVIEHLIEIDRRQLFLGQACSSLFAYCTDRLRYSQDEAHPRVRVARAAQRIPIMLDELRSGVIHLTGLFLLSKHLTEDNAEALLVAARGKSRREIEQLLAEWFPRPDAPEKFTLLPDLPPSTSPEPTRGTTASRTSPAPAELTQTGSVSGTGTATSPAATRSGTGGGAACSQGRFRLEPWSPGRYRVEFTASAELADKLERARELLSHALPSGDLAALIERAVDQLLEHETRRRYGGNPRSGRKRRPLTPGSRHVPLEVARQVWERDGGRCTFVDEEGRRCSARLFLTLEHRQPFALGGPATVGNLCLLCKSHNQHSAREVFGEKHITKKRVEREASRGNLLEKQRPPCEASGGKLLENKRTEVEVYARVLCGLRNLGFRAQEAEAVLMELENRGGQPIDEQLLRDALCLLVSTPERSATKAAADAHFRDACSTR